MVLNIVLQSMNQVLALGAFLVLCAIIAVGVGLNFLMVEGLLRSDGSDSPESKTNCHACGARIPADQEGCDYCGEPVANAD